MKPSKHYKPNSKYKCKSGSVYTIIHKPELGLYRMYRVNSHNDILPSSGVSFTRWIRELQYIGELGEVRYGMDRDEIIEVLTECKTKLADVLIDIRNENTEGEQFDFVSHPRLANVVDGIKKSVDEINSIVYQNN